MADQGSKFDWNGDKSCGRHRSRFRKEAMDLMDHLEKLEIFVSAQARLYLSNRDNVLGAVLNDD